MLPSPVAVVVWVFVCCSSHLWAFCPLSFLSIYSASLKTSLSTCTHAHGKSFFIFFKYFVKYKK